MRSTLGRGVKPTRQRAGQHVVDLEARAYKLMVSVVTAAEDVIKKAHRDGYEPQEIAELEKWIRRLDADGKR